MPNSSQTPDLLVLFTALLALVFSPALSAVLAPYLVIILGALLGTGWGLKRRTPDAPGGMFSFTALMLGTALIFTMPTAVWLQRYLGPGAYQWLLGPLAVVIAAVGDDWPRVGAWAMELGRRVINRRAGEPTE
jgi:hypothetical protein